MTDSSARSGKRVRVPWHPMVFAAALVLGFWLETAVSPYAAFRSLLIAVVITLVLTGVFAALLRSISLGGVAVSLLIGLAWTKQVVAIPADLVARGQAVVAIVVVAALVGIAVLVLRLMLRRRSGMTRGGVTRVFNIASALLLVATLATGLFNGRLLGAMDDLRQGEDLSAWMRGGHGTGSQPNIYVLLLDGYPRSDVLDYAFGIDNTRFVRELERRGLRVAERSHSDYLWTHVSVPSALNMAYVEQIPAMEAVIEGRLPRQPTLRRTISDNAVFDEARSAGYTTIAVGAGFEEVAPRQADVYIDGGQLNEFEISLLMSTWLGDAVGLAAPDFASSQQRQRILFNLDALGQIAEHSDDESVLVFAHVPAPHQPTVFAEGGHGVVVPLSAHYFGDSPSERGEDPTQFLNRYRAQLPYLNERILDAIDAILTNSDQPPVIVLFADHGSASVIDWNVTQPDEAPPARLLERTGTLFAAVTPGHSDVFPDDISPVDIFRLLFDAYLGTDYGRATPPANGGQVSPVDASVLDR